MRQDRTRNAGARPSISWRRLAPAIALALLAAPVVVAAHAVVFPARSTPGAYEKYVLRVPNERDVPTTRVELRFPDEITVVSFGEVDGWELEVVTDAAGRTTSAIWTGTLAVQRFVEFPFIAVNPRTATTLEWPAVQVYAGGDVVEWTGPAGSDAPASFTEIAPIPATSATADDPSGESSTEQGEAAAGGSGTGAGLWLGVVAVAIALIALGMALRRSPQAA